MIENSEGKYIFRKIKNIDFERKSILFAPSFSFLE